MRCIVFTYPVGENGKTHHTELDDSEYVLSNVRSEE